MTVLGKSKRAFVTVTKNVNVDVDVDVDLSFNEISDLFSEHGEFFPDMQELKEVLETLMDPSAHQWEPSYRAYKIWSNL